MIVSDARLLELAESTLDSYAELALAVQHLAIAMLERSNASSLPPGTAPELEPPSVPPKRMPGKPLGQKLIHPCSRCHADVVTFTSKRSGKPYQCDVELGLYQNQRQVLTAPNWFHQCTNAGR